MSLQSLLNLALSCALPDAAVLHMQGTQTQLAAYPKYGSKPEKPEPELTAS